MRKEKLKTIEVIPFRDFKTKLRLIKECGDECKVYVVGNTHLYIERWKYE